MAFRTTKEDVVFITKSQTKSNIRTPLQDYTSNSQYTIFIKTLIDSGSILQPEVIPNLLSRLVSKGIIEGAASKLA